MAHYHLNDICHRAAVFFVKRFFCDLRGMSWVPGCVVVEHGVEDADELSHGGYGDDLVGFTLLLESFGEAFDEGIKLSGIECGHVESLPQGGPSAADVSLSAELAAVAIEGGDADECGDLLSVEISEFG